MGACGTEVKGQGVPLKTCSLRCAGIYGEGERRHLPRIVVCVRNLLLMASVLNSYACVNESCSQMCVYTVLA